MFLNPLVEILNVCRTLVVHKFDSAKPRLNFSMPVHEYVSDFALILGHHFSYFASHQYFLIISIDVLSGLPHSFSI
jgi:hypothetical protein